MKDQFTLSISSPCGENFENFPKTAQGGFCASCTKEVIDFTTMNSTEISNYFNKNGSENTCGRFRASQLNSPLKPKRKSGFINFISGFGLMCLALFSFKTSHAQNTETILKNDNNSRPQNEDVLSKKKITVKGTVMETDIGLPLPGANVILEGSTIGITTDFDGYFEFPIKLKNGDVLVFSYAGFESQKIKISNNISQLNIELEVNMESYELTLLGKVAVKEVYKSKKRD